MADKKSKALFERATEVIPGGVNSPVRAFRAVGGDPVFIERAHGSRMTGADGRSYLDFVASWGPLYFTLRRLKVDCCRFAVVFLCLLVRSRAPAMT